MTALFAASHGPIFRTELDEALAADVLSAFGITDLAAPPEITRHTLAEHDTWARLYELRPRLRAAMTPGRVKQVVDVMHDDATSIALLRDVLRTLGLGLAGRWRHCLSCPAGRCIVHTISDGKSRPSLRFLPGPVRVEWPACGCVASSDSDSDA